MKKNKFSFFMITMIVGFMIAVQFQTVKEPKIRDTRDMWELREALAKERDLHSKLIEEIRFNEETIEKYETQRRGSKEEALKQTLQDLKIQAGLTEVKGPGVILTVEPLFAEWQGKSAPRISPELLKRLVNELNMYEAKEIAIDEKRLINTTVIRDINGETKMNGQSIRQIPFEIKVMTETKQAAKKLHNRMQISPVLDEFFVDNVTVDISQPLDSLIIPAYDDIIRIRDLEPVDEKGEK
ncbi:DUF881 domain-containing protein [Bacillus chungangensis]|uniref:Uncharacterized protein YlxW (UPF0749 family) n=1 Tax=Bacillus chungangensis TaxID=587633 RepID=A0ABT9WWS1_9BACI|nr:DUF881 domain-containing protein [Bacillus chungangensis]MDQ0177657.1 uncharacterized protein YlxW (UPF0749 family) [Bacillus chungangensis]